MDLAAFSKPNGKFMLNGDGNTTFSPKSLPTRINYDSELVGIISEADQTLGQLKGIGQLLPNPELLISPYLSREAVLSSKIEGTQASISDLLRFEATGQEERDSGVIRLLEVRNYVSAFRTNLDDIIKNNKKIDLDLIRNSHRILMTGVRGQEKNPGHFRTVQNWIGREGISIDGAIYVPPMPSILNEKLTELINFIQKPQEGIPSLIQCAILHYQFEAIHPFADGNGRIGRLLISLFLAEQNLLPKPLLYLSAFFEQHRTQYYAGLLAVSQKSRWKEWIKFFLTAISVQSKEAVDNIQRLMDLRTRYQTMLRNRTSGKNALLLLEYLFSNPYTTFNSAQDYLGISFPAAQTAINQLVTSGILKEYGSRKRNRVFYAYEIRDILR